MSKIDQVHEILADYYDEQYKKNPLNAKKNISKIIKDLKERIERIE